MSTTRQNKIARLIQKELAGIFQQRGRALFGEGMITVTEVRISPDLSVAKVYVSLFLAKDKAEMMKKIKSAAHLLRGDLGSRIRNQVRIIPELVFYLDESLDHAQRIEELLKK